MEQEDIQLLCIGVNVRNKLECVPECPAGSLNGTNKSERGRGGVWVECGWSVEMDV